MNKLNDVETRVNKKLSELRESLPKKSDDAIAALKEEIKALPPKECYFNNEDDFVFPITLTCIEEHLLVLLLLEKDDFNKQEGRPLDEVIANLKRTLNDNDQKDRDELDKEQLIKAEEGLIRKFYWRK